MSDDVSSRILTAATLAKQAAMGVRIMSNLQHWTELRNTRFEPYLYKSQLQLIAASGPSHWEAVAAMLRELVRVHYDSGDSYCTVCERDGYPESDHCPSVAALLPLVDQIIRDLGDGQ